MAHLQVAKDDSGRTHGVALVISDDDHRESAIRAKIAKLQEMVKTDKGWPAGTNLTNSVRVNSLFGQRPYHVFFLIDAPNEDRLLQAFDFIEEHFSHVDGFGM